MQLAIRDVLNTICERSDKKGENPNSTDRNSKSNLIDKDFQIPNANPSAGSSIGEHQTSTSSIEATDFLPKKIKTSASLVEATTCRTSIRQCTRFQFQSNNQICLTSNSYNVRTLDSARTVSKRKDPVHCCMYRYGTVQR